MGLIRKSLSITTLGLVNWKSKKELLAEAEAELERTRAGLDATQAELAAASQRRQALESALDETRSQLTQAELSTLHESRRARRRGRSEGRRAGSASLLDRAKQLAEPLVESAADTRARVMSDAEPVLDDVRGRGRRARRKAQAQARSRSEDLRTRAGKLRDQAERRADELRYRTTGRSKKLSTRFRVRGRRLAARARTRADEARAKSDEVAHAAADAASTAKERVADTIEG